MNILVINSGSSSLKAKLFNRKLQELAEFQVYQIGKPECHFMFCNDSEQISKNQKIKNHQQGIKLLKQLLKDYKIDIIGQRVVHGGNRFIHPTPVTNTVKKEIKKLFTLSPLHNPINLQTITITEKTFKNIPQIAVFDTAFHQTIPPKAFMYAIPPDLYQKKQYRKYGFHGTSHKYVYSQATKILKNKKIQAISCHLGNGCSITAIKNGKSLETSMGLTPLAGIPMGTRSGNIDPGLVINLCQKIGSKKTNTLLNKQSGLLALSQHSNHMLQIYQKSRSGDQNCKLAIEHFAYKIAQTISAYTSALSTLDCLIFTGGIGENAYYIRTKVIKQLSLLKIKLDPNKNRKNQLQIHHKSSEAKVLVIPTNEEKQIAQECLDI